MQLCFGQLECDRWLLAVGDSRHIQCDKQSAPHNIIQNNDTSNYGMFGVYPFVALKSDIRLNIIDVKGGR